MRRFAAAFAVFAFVASVGTTAAAALPKGFEMHGLNGPTPPVVTDDEITFHVDERGCSKVDYGDGRGESDCANGNVKSQIRKSSDAKLGQSLEYRFDVWVDPAFGYQGYFEGDAVTFRPNGWDSKLRIASWEGEFIKNFVYILKLDAKNGATFFGKQCFPPADFGKWVPFSMKVRWANDETGWVKVTCGDRIVYAEEGEATTRQIQCYYANECDPADNNKKPTRINYLLGLAMNGFGMQWAGTYGAENLFTKLPAEGLTIKMRNVAVTADAVLYGPEDRARIQKLQEILNALGCDVGSPDGIPGRKTRAAALGCRVFDAEVLPDKLNIGTAQTFIDLYGAPEAAGLPKGSASQ